MYYNKFDIVSAYYLYFSLCHTGQSSKEYSRLSKINRYYHNPVCYFRDLSDNAKEIFINLLEKNNINLFDVLDDDDVFDYERNYLGV